MLPCTSAADVARSLPDTVRSFADELLAMLNSAASPRSKIRVLDVGAGVARIPIEICTRQAGIEIVAVDLRPRILQRARTNIDRAGLGDSICVNQADACSLPYADASFDAVISNALLHHLPRRRDALLEMLRVVRPAGVLLVRDSLRQPDAAKIARILASCAGGTTGNQRNVFQDAFHAALNLDEVRDMACAAGLTPDWVRQAGSRHWMICGHLPDFICGGFPLNPLQPAATLPRV